MNEWKRVDEKYKWKTFVANETTLVSRQNNYYLFFVFLLFFSKYGFYNYKLPLWHFITGYSNLKYSNSKHLIYLALFQMQQNWFIIRTATRWKNNITFAFYIQPWIFKVNVIVARAIFPHFVREMIKKPLNFY